MSFEPQPDLAPWHHGTRAHSSIGPKAPSSLRPVISCLITCWWGHGRPAGRGGENTGNLRRVEGGGAVEEVDGGYTGTFTMELYGGRNTRNRWVDMSMPRRGEAGGSQPLDPRQDTNTICWLPFSIRPRVLKLCVAMEHPVSPWSSTFSGLQEMGDAARGAQIEEA